MDPKIITSRTNGLIEKLRELRDDPPGYLLFLEGPKLLEEALKSSLVIDQLIYVAETASRPDVQTALALAREKVQVTPYVLEGLSDVEAPQGVIAIVRKPASDWQQLLAKAPNPLMILDGIQNSGNAATIVRTAEAAGAAGVITTPGSARLFSPKALRGAMGSSLRLPVLEHQTVDVIVDKLAAAGYALLTAASPSAESIAYDAVDWTRACACVVGQEGRGLSAQWDGKKQTRIHIPMAPAVESLNVAAAAAILLYAARR